MAEKENIIYRFKISNPSLYEQMINFAHTNQFLCKQELIEKYKEWSLLPMIRNMIKEEEDLLRRYDYDLKKTNINQKVFKSIKYYHIKNLIETRKMKLINSDEVSLKENEIKSFKFSKELILKVKEYLDSIDSNESKPSICCDSFIKDNIILLNTEKDIVQLSGHNQEHFDMKFKKMFKNQCFFKFKK